MVGIRRLLKIGQTVGIYHIFKNWQHGGYPPHIEKLTIWRVSTPYLKLGNMVDTYSKIDDTVCIHHVLKNKGILWISTAHRKFEAEGVYPPSNKNEGYSGYPLCIQK